MLKADLDEKKKRANNLRKEGQYNNALSIYRVLWAENGDKFDGAGLLHCLRKLNLYEEALILSKELIDKYQTFKWCRNEVIWTYIYGELYKCGEGDNLNRVLQIAEKIEKLNPEPLPAKIVTFKVLKKAKESKEWDVLNEWITLINPELLSAEPMINDSGKRGWSEQSRWYYYRALGLVNTGKMEGAIELINMVLEKFPHQKKFFLRLKADAYCALGEFNNAEIIYKKICINSKIDWWLLHRYSLLLESSGRNEEALILMYKAAYQNPKLEVMVKLFEDIGRICRDLGRNEEARNHLLLCKYIREKNEWTISEQLLMIDNLNNASNNHQGPKSLEEALQICKNYWTESCKAENALYEKFEEGRRIRKNLLGRINLGSPDRSFCFINNEKESFFCSKSDLPEGIKDGDNVKFDGIPSFDKKKQKKSWKATNISL